MNIIVDKAEFWVGIIVGMFVMFLFVRFKEKQINKKQVDEK